MTGREQVQQRARQGRGYSITSLARASSVGGTSRPSAFAVLRLITSSNLVACWTGRLANAENSGDVFGGGAIRLDVVSGVAIPIQPH